MTAPHPARILSPLHPLSALPPLEQLLQSGGDERITAQTGTDSNYYGCQPRPDDNLIALGSSTATTISTASHAAAGALYRELIQQTATRGSYDYPVAMAAIRQELLALCGLGGTDSQLIFAASGTDLHRIVAHLVCHDTDQSSRPLTVLMAHPDETGHGVPLALTDGFSDDGQPQIQSIALRNNDGTPRPTAAVDADFAAHARAALTRGRRILLILTDQSKTGLIAPSPQLAITLKQQHGDHLEVLVDACQFRLSNTTLHAYLAQDFLLALTGSKFMTGPSFSGALLLSGKTSQRLQTAALPASASHSLRGDWPADWAKAHALSNQANTGLLLRWEAALCEIRRFHALDATAISNTLHAFNQTLRQALDQATHIELVATPAPQRDGLHDNANSKTNWDEHSTLHTLRLYHDSARQQPLDAAQTRTVYQQLRQHPRIQLGQPVNCGQQQGKTSTALRLCFSARLVCQANHSESARQAVLAQITHAILSIAQAITTSEIMQKN